MNVLLLVQKMNALVQAQKLNRLVLSGVEEVKPSYLCTCMYQQKRALDKPIHCYTMGLNIFTLFV